MDHDRRQVYDQTDTTKRLCKREKNTIKDKDKCHCKDKQNITVWTDKNATYLSNKGSEWLIQ